MPPEMGNGSSSCEGGNGSSALSLPPVTQLPEDPGSRDFSRSARQICEQQQFGGHPSRDIKAHRTKISFVRHPFVTLRYFGNSVGRWGRSLTRTVTNHPAFVFVVVPGAGAWVLLRTFPGPQSAAIDEVEHHVKFVVWWVGLGVLSSIGLGFGIQTGILFLLPHIMKTCLTAEACDSLDFRASGDMWFSGADDLFACPEKGEAFLEPEDGGMVRLAIGASVTYVGTFLKVYPACLLWGIGSAIGEIPPYALSRAATEAGEEVEEGEELRELGRRDPVVGKFDLATRSKVWMISLLKRKGFMGIFFLAAIPNMAFDLCGMACGAALVPFWTFFGGTLLGKAIVRVWIQTAFFTMLFHKEHLDSFISIVRSWTPSKWDLGGLLYSALMQSKDQFREIGDNNVTPPVSTSEAGFKSQMKAAWTAVLLLFVAIFLVSVVEQVARRSVAEEEKEAMRDFVEKSGKQTGAQSDRKGPAMLEAVADNTKKVKNVSPGNQ